MSSEDRHDQLWQYKGITFPSNVTKEALEAMPSFQMRDGDIVVASYPKTGTNWLVEIVLKILIAAGTPKDHTDGMVTAPLEVKLSSTTQSGYAILADMPSPRLMITHLPIQFVPPGISKPQKQVKVLRPMRKPKDTFVSLFHYSKKVMPLMGISGDLLKWEDFADDFLNEKASLYVDYCDHLLGWWQMRDDPHFLFLKYEDMKKDLLSAVKAMVAFLEVDLDESAVNDIAEASTFHNMKPDLDNAKMPERKMIARKGIVGDWKNMFSPEQSKAFDAWYEKKLGGTGITFYFE